MRIGGKNPPARKGAYYRIGDMLNCNPEYDCDPEWDLGIVTKIDNEDGEYIYSVKWADNGSETVEREEWLINSTTLISTKK